MPIKWKLFGLGGGVDRNVHKADHCGGAADTALLRETEFEGTQRRVRLGPGGPQQCFPLLQPSGAYAVNLLGLSEQVPARIVFLTDGPARHVRVGRQEIILKNTTPRNMATAGRISGTVIQALRHLGARQIGEQHIAHLRQTTPTSDKAQLKRDRIYAPGWMHRIIDAIAEDSHRAFNVPWNMCANSTFA